MYKRHRLTIISIEDRIGLIKSIKDLYYAKSLSERADITKNLPYIDEMYTDPTHIEKVLGPYCEYSYVRIPEPGCTEFSIPPCERQEYLDASSWLLTLSPEDQERVRWLIIGAMPWG